jgi:hypothetical protein
MTEKALMRRCWFWLVMSLAGIGLWAFDAIQGRAWWASMWAVLAAFDLFTAADYFVRSRTARDEEFMRSLRRGT